MNREIKFRGLTPCKRWAHGSLVSHKQQKSGNIEAFIFESPMDYYLANDVPVEPSTIGQYTGLKDRFGKEIFEGDIVNGASFNGSYAHGEVVWWTGGWCIQPIPNIEGITELYLNVSTYEVIGNVYENKELTQKIKGE